MASPTAKEPAGAVKEWHFHTYWLAQNERSTAAAQALRDALVAQVAADPTFVAVCNGVSRAQLPALEGSPPPMNRAPVGPHLSGSFETWAPIESFARVYSWFTLHRGDLSILVHPLTRYERDDHTVHASWLGQPWVLDLDRLRHDLVEPPAQYPELGLGYNGSSP